IGARFLFGRAPETRGKSQGKNRRLIPRSGMGGAVLGVAISLVPLVLVLLISDGMIQGITERYLATKTHHAQIALPLSLSETNEAKVLETLRSIPGVESAFLERNGEGLALSGKSTHAVSLRSISPDFYTSGKLQTYLEVLQGELQPKGNGVVIGTALAERLGIELGDSLTIVTASRGQEEMKGEGGPYAFAPGSGYAPRLSFFKVTGIVSAGYRDLDANWAFIDESKGRNLIDYPSSIFFAGLRVEDPYSESLGGIIDSAAEKLELLFPAWFIRDLARPWPEIERSLFRSFSTTKSMLALIMAIALVVACINLGSALSTFVAERSIEIAIMRSFGANDATIRSIFVGAGFVTGTLGTISGLGIGLLFSLGINDIITILEFMINYIAALFAGSASTHSGAIRVLDPAYYLERIPVKPDFPQLLFLGLASLALCLAASALPARKATKVSVLDLMRKS
ncbi:MAG TPA: FtsX-like permease family protein, partial [Rectinemataceae bacterium]